MELRASTLTPRGRDDGEDITAGESWEWRLPPRCGGGRGALADGHRRGGRDRRQRTAGRATYRNGYRDRTPDSRLGSLQLRIPKLRQGGYFPPFLEARKMSGKALVAVIQG